MKLRLYFYFINHQSGGLHMLLNHFKELISIAFEFCFSYTTNRSHFI